MYVALTDDWLMKPEHPLLSALLSRPILALYEAEGFNDDVWTCICAVTGFYNEDVEVCNQERAKAAQILLAIANYCALYNGTIIDLLEEPEWTHAWGQLPTVMANQFQVPPADRIYDFYAAQNVSREDFFKYIKRIETDTSILPSFITNLLYLEAHPVLASFKAMIDTHLITPTGGLNYTVINQLERLGYRHRVIERDLCDPLRCGIKLKKGEFYYG